LTFDDVQIAASETVAAVSGYVGVINAQESEKKLREIWLPL
jgi:cell division protein FtsI/penicillin-binding protein 2